MVPAGRTARWLRHLAKYILNVLPERVLAMLLPTRIGFDPRATPSPPVVPDNTTRLFIGPANSAGQGWQWARCFERNIRGVSAVSMAAVHHDSFQFPVDYAVPLGNYRWSHSWQRAQQR